MRKTLLSFLLSFFTLWGFSQQDVTFSVDMTPEAGNFTTVYVSGSFNSWCGDCDALTDMGSNIWGGTLNLNDGDYEFKYTFDNWTGQEGFMPGDPCTKTTGCNTNRAFAVAGAPVDLGTNCYSICGDCAYSPANGNVTVSVDMTNVGGFTDLYISGSFNNWCGNCDQLTNMGGDSWGTTIALDGGSYEYKFTADDWTTQEALTFNDPCTVECGGNINRRLHVNGDTTVPMVCWNSCEGTGCEVVADSINITWELNMENEVVAMDGIWVAGGSAFGVAGSAQSIELTDPDGDDIYTGTTRQPVGFESFYTFVNGAACSWACKENIAGQDCADPDNFNDRLVANVQSDTLIQTCFGQCTTDGTCSPPVPPTMVTFQVDMSDYADPFTAMYVFGSFNGWSSGANMMTDMGNGLWATTIELDQGQYEYKFIVDGDIPGPEEMLTEGDPCTINGPPFVNRVISVDQVDPISTPAFCFGSCNECGAVSTVNILDNNELFELYPTLANASTFIQFNEVATAKQLEVYNAIGQVVYAETVSAGTTSYTLRTADLASGLYIVSVLVEDQKQLQKIVVNH
ncbi:MAG: T9SS type A sorting domain-containing protein [Bacteroidota bacterium]